MHGDFCFRYVSADDFGKPDNSFIVRCVEDCVLCFACSAETKLSDVSKHGGEL